MSKNIEHIQHVKSATVENGNPKLPSASQLLEGELGVNYANGYEVIALKNSDNKVVKFSSDDYYSKQKLGSGFTGENSAVTVTDVIAENEEITSAALNDLNDAITEHTEDTGVHVTQSEKSTWNNKADVNHGHVSNAVSAMTGYIVGTSSGSIVTSDTLNVAIGKLEKRANDVSTTIGSGFTNESITKVTEDNEYAIASSINDLNTAISTHSVNATAHVSATDRTNWNGKASATHGHSSNSISAMTNYSVAQTSAYINISDTLNVAIGKLEKRINDLTAQLADLEQRVNNM